MSLTSALVFSTLLTTTTAWTYRPSYGAILDGNSTQAFTLRQAASTPNDTASVPFVLDGHNLTLRLNLTDAAIPGADTNVQDPRVILTTAEFTWPSNATRSEIFGDSSGSSDDDDGHSGYCVSTVGGNFSSNTVTGRNDGDGSCLSDFGQDCLDALSTGLGDCGTPFYPPSACQNAFEGTEGVYTMGISGGSNASTDANANSLFAMGHDSDIVAGSDSQEQYQQLSENLQFYLIRGPEGSHTSVPICARVVVSGSAGLRLSMSSWLAPLVAVAVAYSMA